VSSVGVDEETIKSMKKQSKSTLNIKGTRIQVSFV